MAVSADDGDVTGNSGTGGRPAAPGALALVQAFVNTRDLDSGEEELRTPADLTAWLRMHDLLTGDVEADAAGLKEAIALREAFRELLYANNDETLPNAASVAFERLAAGFPLAATVDAHSTPALRPLAGGVRGALARIIATACEAGAHGTWARLKACRSDTCRWVFYDTSKNRSGTWCNMAVCGNRAKVRAYQRRRRGESDGQQR